MGVTYNDCLNAIKRQNARPFPEPLNRPLNQLEQQVLYALFSISCYMDMADPVLSRRLPSIKMGKTRIGLIRWAAMSVFRDVVAQLPKESTDRFSRQAKLMQLSVRARAITDVNNEERLISSSDLEIMALAAWRGQCELCGKTGQEAKQCKLKKLYDKLQCMETSDCKDCWYKVVE